MVSTPLTCLLLLLATGAAFADDEADISAFHADGETTYCKIMPVGPPRSPYKGLTTASAGECPVIVKLSIMASSFTMTSSEFDISWTAAVNPSRSDANYPAKLENGKIRIQLSSVYACKLNTTCENDDVIYQVTTFGRDNILIDTQSITALQLTSFRLEIPSKGQYIVVGEIVVDSGVSTDNGISEYVSSMALQRVRASSDGITPPGTIRPPSTGFASPTAQTTAKSTTAPPRIASNLPSSAEGSVVEAKGSDDGKLASRSYPGSSSGTVALVLIGVVGVIAATLFFVYARKRNESSHKSTYTDSIDSLDLSTVNTSVAPVPAQSPVPALHDRRVSVPTQSPVPAFHDRPPVQPMKFGPFANSMFDTGANCAGTYRDKTDFQSESSLDDTFRGNSEVSSVGSFDDSYRGESENFSINDSMAQSSISYVDSFRSVGTRKCDRPRSCPDGRRKSLVPLTNCTR